MRVAKYYSNLNSVKHEPLFILSVMQIYIQVSPDILMQPSLVNKFISSLNRLTIEQSDFKVTGLDNKNNNLFTDSDYIKGLSSK